MSDTVIVESEDQTTIITEITEVHTIESEVAPVVHVIESISVGPPGPPGPPGSVPDGSDSGDILRWNEATGSWEIRSEPFELKGIVLTPAIESLIDAEGAIYYNANQKAVLVCTDI